MESWQDMEDSALRLFTLSAKVDFNSITSQVDMLEEIERWKKVEPGVPTVDGVVTESQVNVLKDDKSIQRRAILLNLAIGDRQLELIGSPNPEVVASG